MESLLNRKYKKQQAAAAKAGPSKAPTREQADTSVEYKKGTTQNVKELDNQSMASSVPQPPPKPVKEESILDRWADTKKGKILDTAAAFVGLPHICSNE